jgi:hypothetical protein
VLLAGLVVDPQSTRRAREINAENGSSADLAVDRDRPAGLLDEPVDHGQPETSALPRPLGRKERLEGAPADLLGHADSGISH